MVRFPLGQQPEAGRPFLPLLFLSSLLKGVTPMIRLLGALVAFALVFAAESAEAQVYQVYYPAPVAAYYAPAPTTVYYAPPVATYYRRPLLGGTVSGWRYNAPATTYVYPATYPSTVAYYPAW